MPALDLNLLKSLEGNYTDYKTFIETGTYVGETILSFEPYFENLHTIEINPNFYNDVKNRYQGEKINFHLGDSSVVFKEILPQIKEPAIIFLDGHWSSGDTGRGSKDVPLLEELEVINTSFTPNAIIIVDDCRLFGKGPSTNTEIVDWEEISIEKVLKNISNRTEKFYFRDSQCAPNDRLILHIKALN